MPCKNMQFFISYGHCECLYSLQVILLHIKASFYQKSSMKKYLRVIPLGPLCSEAIWKKATKCNKHGCFIKILWQGTQGMCEIFCIPRGAQGANLRGLEGADISFEFLLFFSAHISQFSSNLKLLVCKDFSLHLHANCTPFFQASLNQWEPV